MSFALRPALLCTAGVSAVGLTSYFLFNRWRRLLEQQPTMEDVATLSGRGMEDHEQDMGPHPSGVFSATANWSAIFLWTTDEDLAALQRGGPNQGVCVLIRLSNNAKMVEVKLQHKATYDRLESEHWWLLVNDFYNVLSPELPPKYFARATAVACIKRIGSSISEAQFYLRTEFSDSSVQDVLLKTKVAITFKRVSVDADGRFRCHDSDDSQSLETPASFTFSSKPRRPPPGF